MDIKLYSIGSNYRDYPSVTTWDADLAPDLSDFFNVGVLYDDSDMQSEYESFVELESHSQAGPHFVLMTETGVMLASRVAAHFHKVNASFPPVQPSPFPNVEGMDTEEIIGHGAQHNLEDIARTYIHQRLDDYDRSVDRSEVHILFDNTYKNLALLIYRNPALLDDIEWRELEKLMEEVLTGIGYSVTLTSASKDGGKDLILECRPPSGKRTYLVEIKHWRSEQKVGAKTIKDFHQVVVREKAHGGLFLSTYGVANNVFERLTEVERRMVRIGTNSKVVTLCRSYVRSTNGVILPSTELPEYLFTDTMQVSE